MKTWQRISFFLIALVLCLGLLGMNQLGGSGLHLDAPKLGSWAGYLADFPVVGSSSPLTPQPDVSWNSRAAWLFDEPQPDVSWNSRIASVGSDRQTDVSWNSRIAWFVGEVQPCVSWNS